MKKCTYCEYRKLFKSQRVKGYDLYTCQKCGLMMTDIPAKQSQKKVNAQVYSDEYLKLYEERQLLLIKRFASKVKLIDKLSSGGNILDVGCSTGLFLQSLDKFSQKEWNKYGIDINKKSIDLANQKKLGKILCSDLHHKYFSDNFFDVVTCFDVLEHDTNVKENLKEIRRILKPNGVLVIQVPNKNSLMAKLCGDNWDWWSVPDHVYHFSPYLLKKILIDNGFTLMKMYTWENTMDFIGNVRGTIRVKVSNRYYLNRVLSRCSFPALMLLAFLLKIFETFTSIGGLGVIVAIKKDKIS
jgi:ubiquinone/menaquinone biosynthesis C-methylase UbiE